MFFESRSLPSLLLTQYFFVFSRYFVLSLSVSLSLSLSALHSLLDSTHLGAFVVCNAIVCACVSTVCSFPVFFLADRPIFTASAPILACAAAVGFCLSALLLSAVLAIARALLLCYAMAPFNTREYLNAYADSPAGDRCVCECVLLLLHHD